MNLRKTLIPSITLFSLLCTGVMAASTAAKKTGTYVLKNPVVMGKQIKFGGFSSLIHLPKDPKNVFYVTGDRGPNGEIKTEDGKTLRTFPLEKFTPSIYKISINKGEIKILETIPLKLSKGTDPITGTNKISGVSNFEKLDETPYDELGKTVLSYDPYGVDTEGLSYNPKDNTFWICEEYRPSIVQVKRDGTILQRIIPKGDAAKFSKSPNIPVKEVIPAVYNKRNTNRGFEGVTITPDGKYMFVSIQSPLANPDKDTPKNSRVLRILKIDLSTLKPVAEYAYQAEDAKAYEGVAQYDVVISDLHAVNQNVLLVDERDKNAGAKAKIKRIYAVDFSKATNVLGKFDAVKDKKLTLDQMSPSQLKAYGINTPSKKLVLDVLQYGYPFEKLEGLTMTDAKTLAVVNDNDYGFTYENGKVVQTGVTTELWTFELPNTLK